MKGTNSCLKAAAKAALLILAFASQLRCGAATTIVAPNNLANTDGNAGDNEPFHNSSPLRVQDVYNASEFSAIGAGGGYITALSFRGDAQPQGFITTVTNMQINLSTTTKSADRLSLVFAENVGTDDKVVFGPGLLHLDTGPGSFGARIPFSSPFYYNPNAGNLLLDLRNLSAGNAVGTLDAVSTTGDAVSSIIGGVNSSSAFLADTVGYVVQFEVTPVPEPGTLALALFA